MTVIYYLVYPQIVAETFGLFNCTEIEGVSYLVKNTNITCFDQRHFQIILLLGIPNLVIWIFGVPLLIFYILYSRRKELDNSDNLRTYGFWYLGLKRDIFYWELLLEVKKLLMILIAVDISKMG